MSSKDFPVYCILPWGAMYPQPQVVYVIIVRLRTRILRIRKTKISRHKNINEYGPISAMSVIVVWNAGNIRQLNRRNHWSNQMQYCRKIQLRENADWQHNSYDKKLWQKRITKETSEGVSDEVACGLPRNIVPKLLEKVSNDNPPIIANPGSERIIRVEWSISIVFIPCRNPV